MGCPFLDAETEADAVSVVKAIVDPAQIKKYAGWLEAAVPKSEAAARADVNPDDAIGPDGLSNRERRINSDPKAWGHDPDTDPSGPETDDRGDIKI
jgi:hypothetical protein